MVVSRVFDTTDPCRPASPRPDTQSLMHAETITRTELETDVVFDLLSSPRRRTALQVLHEEGDVIDDLRTLADHVAARETGKQPDQLTRPERKRVYVSLYQTHIPKLEEAGAITFDKDDNLWLLENVFAPVVRRIDW